MTAADFQVICEDENMNFLCDHEETLTQSGQVPVDREAERERRQEAKDAGIYYQSDDPDSVSWEEWVAITQTQTGELDGLSLEDQFQMITCVFGPDSAGSYFQMELTLQSYMLMCADQEDDDFCDCS